MVILQLQSRLNDINNILLDTKLEKVYWTKYTPETYSNIAEELAKDNTMPQNLFDGLQKLISIKNDSYKCNYLDKELFRSAVEELLPIVNKIAEKQKQNEYKNITVNYEYYKAKTVLHDNDNNIVYIIASFYTKQAHDAFLANLQKGLKSGVTIDGLVGQYNTIKNGYISKGARAKDENAGDGYHAVIYNDNERVLRVHNGNPVETVFNWLVQNTNTGLIPEWSDYLYNTLFDNGHITECDGFDLTGKAPKILIMAESINTDLLRTIKAQGLVDGKIMLPVSNTEELRADTTFLELIQKYVISNLKDEKCHYNIGDQISSIIDSPIHQGKKITKLFPRQQVIAQGFLNAAKAGKNALYFNGGMGVGKTYSSLKLSYAIIKEHFKSNTGRICIMAPGHLISKWKRQAIETLKPLGVNPIFYEITNFEQVKDIPKESNGLEIFLLPKDKIKRNYQLEYGAISSKFNYNSLYEISKYTDSINETITEADKIIVQSFGDLKINFMKLAANRIHQSLKRPTILYKTQLDADGNICSYKIATPSKLLKEKYGHCGKAYDFILSTKEFEIFLNYIKENQEYLVDEGDLQIQIGHRHLNGIICPCCGGFQWASDNVQFDEEKYKENIVMYKPIDKANNNRVCNNYIKADGTPLMSFEREKLIREEIEAVYTEVAVKNPYQDAEGNAITGNDLIKVKSGKYTGTYKIIIKKCNDNTWSAKDQEGYRTVNAAQMLLKKFGKRSFDILIGDEVHLYSHESSQGYTFGLLCQLCKIKIALTGTLTGGKSSDMFYLLYRMDASLMKRLGYKYSDIQLFIDHFGRKKKVTKEYKNNDKFNKSGQGKISCSGWNEIPGVSPILYTNFLSGSMISRTLNDMNIPMPKLKYYKVDVEMSEELRKGYNKLKDDIVEFINENKVSIGGTYLHALLSYTDNPVQEPLMWAGDTCIAVPTPIDVENRLLPKEIKLLEIIKRELSEGRRTLLYTTYTGKKGVSVRLMDVLRAAGIRVAELKSSLKLEKREDWIQEQYEKGIEVILTNPTNVETGLDIVQYPTVYYYGLSYNIKTVRQSEVRPWRPNQSKEVRIYYSYYKDSLQEDCIKLVGSKKKASLQLEGCFSEDMLSAMGEYEDTGSSALYKVLQGKVKLKEEELDAIGFEQDFAADNEIVDNIIDLVDLANRHTESQPVPQKKSVQQQMEMFVLTKESIKNIKGKTKKTISEGQLSMFAV